MSSENTPTRLKTTPLFTITAFDSSTTLVLKDDISDDYSPSAERNPAKGGSSIGALAHLLKGSLGTGILAMPMAFYNAGLVFGMIGTLVVGFLCTHCVHILVKTSQHICKSTRAPALTFAETAQRAFEGGPVGLRPWSNFAKQFVDFALMITYFAAACVYIVFVATSFQNVINYDYNLNWNIRIYIAIVLIPCLIIGQLRSLKWLVPFSAVANLAIIVTFGITLYYMFSVPLDFDKPLIAQPTQIPLFFSTVVFALEGIGVVMPVENSMKKPQQFLGCPGVLNIAMFTVVLLYAVIGFFGYVRYGDQVQGSITLNLQQGAPLADAAKLLMGIAILCTFGLQFYVPNKILWSKVKHKFQQRHYGLAQSLLRLLITLVLGGISVAIPDLGPFISLVGAICFSLLGLFIPSIIESVYLWPHFGVWKWKLWKNMIMAVLAILALITGAVASIEQIVDMYKNGG